MMLKPTFPMPYMTGIDVEDGVVMTCMINERNYIEGYDLCISYKENNNDKEYHVIGFAQPSKRMYKFAYVLDKKTELMDCYLTPQHNASTANDANFNYYKPDEDVNETQLPINNSTKTELRIKIPLTIKNMSVSGTMTDLKSIIFNGDKYSWKIRLFGKGSIIGWGKLTLSSSDHAKGTFAETDNKNFITTSKISAPSETYPSGFIIVGGDITSNFLVTPEETQVSFRAVTYDTDYIDMQVRQQYYAIIFKGKEPADMSQSSFFYFTTNKTPTVSVGKSLDYWSPDRKTILGSYQTYDDNIALDYWIVKLYNEKGIVCEDSGIQTGVRISYQLQTVLPYNSGNYAISLECHFNNGMHIVAENEVSYLVFCTSEIGGNSHWSISNAHYVDVIRKDDSLSIDFSQTKGWLPEHEELPGRTCGWALFKRECITQKIAYIGFFTSDDVAVDYNIRSGKEYEYLVVHANCLDGVAQFSGINDSPDGKYYHQFLTRTPVRANVCSWMVYDLIKTEEDNVYTIDKNNIWKFNVGIKNGKFSPEYNKTTESTFGKYPKIYAGRNNYLSGSLECYIGNVSCSGRNPNYRQDDIYGLKLWQDFCTNGHIKLLKSPKGHIIICDIVNTSYDVNNSPMQETVISFDYTQLADEDTITVYEVL